MQTASTLADELIRAEQDGARAILLDLRDLTFLDSTGLLILLQAKGRSRTNGHRFVVVGARPIARRVLEITGTLFLIDDPTATSVMDQFTGGQVQSELNHQANVGQDG